MDRPDALRFKSPEPRIHPTAELKSCKLGRYSAIGERVIVIATSTGAALAVQAATTPAMAENVAAMVLISPNFGVRASGAELLTMPWGKQMAELIVGTSYSFEPKNALHKIFWTTRYPTSALLPMAAMAKLALEAPVEETSIPALFIFSDSDRVVRSNLTREIAVRWGGPKEIVPIDDTDDPNHHVIAGNALSPSTTYVLAERIIVWAKAILD